MSFVTDIYSVMTSDTSLNELVDGGIHYENLIDNWLANTDDNVWIVYDFRKTLQTNCINTKNIFMTYGLSVIVIQRNTNTKIDTITSRLIDYLNNLTLGKIQDVYFMSDQSGFDQQKNIYTNALEFECIYIEN